MRTMSVETSKAMLKQCAARKIKIIKMPKNKNYDRGLFKCACGAEYEATASYVLSRIGCPECVKKNAYAKMSATNSGKPSKRKKTHAQHVAEFASFEIMYLNSFICCKHLVRLAKTSTVVVPCIRSACGTPRLKSSFSRSFGRCFSTRRSIRFAPHAHVLG